MGNLEYFHPQKIAVGNENVNRMKEFRTRCENTLLSLFAEASSSRYLED
jgi:hypothetical protein